MSVESMIWAAGAVGAALFAGYLWGVRVSRGANRALRNERGVAEQEVERLRQEAGLRQELLTKIERTLGDFSSGQSLRADLEGMLAPLLQRERDQRGLGEAVQRLLAPMVERERKGLALAEAGAGATRRGELPALLESLAERGDFQAVVLSDETGLPLAASRRAQQPEVLAACSSLILTLSDRLRSSGEPDVRSVLVRDDAQRLTVHRVLNLGGERYVLVAITSSPGATPEILDPALPRIEALLGRGAPPSDLPAFG